MINILLCSFVAIALGIIIGVAITEISWEEKIFNFMKKFKKEK